MEGDVSGRKDVSNPTMLSDEQNNATSSHVMLGKADCQRVILHFDVDAFYAQCEVGTHRPRIPLFSWRVSHKSCGLFFFLISMTCLGREHCPTVHRISHYYPHLFDAFARDSNLHPSAFMVQAEFSSVGGFAFSQASTHTIAMTIN